MPCESQANSIKQAAEDIQFGVYDCNGALPVNLSGVTSPR